MTMGNFSMILLNIALVLFVVSYSETYGPNINDTVKENIDSKNLSFKDQYNEDIFNLDIHDDILLESNNAQKYNLKSAQAQTTTNEQILNEIPLKRIKGKLDVQRRKLLNIKQKVYQLFKDLSDNLDKFCALPEKTNPSPELKNIDEGANEINDLSYENNVEYNNVVLYSREIKNYLNKKHYSIDIYTNTFLPNIQKNLALQRYIKNTINECTNLIEFIHKKNGSIHNIKEYLKEEDPQNKSYSVSMYSLNDETGENDKNDETDENDKNDETNQNDGFFKSTTAKITLGILGCLLVSGGIAFAFYYKKIMLKN